MQSVSSNALMDMGLSSPRGSGLADRETRVRRQCVNCINLKRTNPKRIRGIVACAVERNENGKGENESTSRSSSTSSFLSRSHTYALMKRQMEQAAKSEVCVLDYLRISFFALNVCSVFFLRLASF